MSEYETNNNTLTAELVRDLIKERRRDRRWRTFRFLIIFGLIGFLLFTAFSSSTPDPTDKETGIGSKYISLVRLNGVIAPEATFSAEQVIPLLRQAFADKEAKGVILDINSGGGTPVQAAIIHDEILKLKKKYNKKVIVVGEDMLASGAYLVAVSADKIYVNANTITGSIGVIMAGFGFPDLIQKIGVDRRVYASGAHKDRLDPFLAVNPDDVTKVHSVTDEVHANFNQIVMDGRKGKLPTDTTELFSGDFWTGQGAMKLGLVDGLGDLYDVMQTEFQVGRFRDYSQGSSVLKNLLSQMSSKLGLPLRGEQHMHLTSEF
jgi:protease-4